MTLRHLVILCALTAASGCASAPTRPQAPPAVAAPAPRSASAATAAAAPSTTPLVPQGPPVERIAVPLGGAERGPSTAKVTIVEFSDFQCPFCGRVLPTLEQLLRDYPNDVRILFRHDPLPFHDNAALAAEAAAAAGMQGKFWEMHDRLFADQIDLQRPALELHAVQLGLDLTAFRAALDGHAGKARVDEDLALGRQLGVRGTPTFFIDGRPLLGAQPLAAFKQIIDDELARADSLLRRGLPRDQLYATLLSGAKPAMANGANDDPEPEADLEVYPVKPGDAPAKGPASAPLVLVIFSDFQCPFCKRVEPTLAEVESHYRGKVRVVWKNFPLPFHANAGPAAEAAMAADAQGKFWPMHDRLFAHNTELDRQSLENDAAAVGLDLPRFRADLDAGRYRARIEADKQEGTDLGVVGTPAVFINGRKIAGAYPFETFQRIADEELAKLTARPPARTAATTKKAAR